MTYAPFAWEDEPSHETPIDSANLELFGAHVAAQPHGTAVDTGAAMRIIVLSTGQVIAIPAAAVAPSAPEDLECTVRLTSVRLAWAPGAGAASYAITRDGTQIATTSESTYRDSAITPGATYSYRVASIDQYGQRSAATSPVSAFVDPELNEPPSVDIRCWPPELPTNGVGLIRLNAIDVDVQALALELSVDAGQLQVTEDPSVWLVRI